MAEDDNHIDVTTSEMGSESNQAVASENDYIWQSDDESEGCDDDPTDDYNPGSEDGVKKDKKKPKRAASKRKPKNSSADSNTAKRPKRNANKKDNLNDSFDEFEDESQKKTKNKKTQKPKKSVKISPHGSSSLSNEEDDNGPKMAVDPKTGKSGEKEDVTMGQKWPQTPKWAKLAKPKMLKWANNECRP